MGKQSKKEITVDGDKYVVQFYPPSFGITLWAKLVRLMGQPIIKLVGMFSGDKLKGKSVMEALELDFVDLDMDAASNALAALFSQLKDEDLVPLLKDILSCTFMTKDGMFNTPVSDVFDSDEFAGRYLHLFKVAGRSLGVQYPDFLSGLVKRKSAVKDASASSPTTAATRQ